MTTASVAPAYGETVAWEPERPKFRPVRLFISLLVTAAALAIAAAVLPGVHPVELSLPEEPIVGAEQVHAVLSGWRRGLQSGAGDRVLAGA